MSDRQVTDSMPAGQGWRRRLEWAIPTVAVVTAVAVPLLVWGRLPEPMASHWGLGGRPDAAATRIVDLLVLALVAIVVGFGPLLGARARMPRSQARVLVAVATGGSALVAILRVLSVRANLDTGSWNAAGDLTGPMMLSAFGAAGLVAAAGAWLVGDRPDERPDVSLATPVATSGSEVVIWTGQATSRAGTVVPALLLLATALGAWLVPGPARAILVLALTIVAASLTALGQARVTAGPHGLTVALGWFGWPRLRVPLTDIADVTVEVTGPMAYGGWGLRVVPGTTAVVIRAGTAIRVERRSRRAFVVTVDDALQGAGALLANARA